MSTACPKFRMCAGSDGPGLLLEVSVGGVAPEFIALNDVNLGPRACKLLTSFHKSTPFKTVDPQTRTPFLWILLDFFWSADFDNICYLFETGLRNHLELLFLTGGVSDLKKGHPHLVSPLVQTDDQQQDGYFNNWVSKNISKSAICQPFVEKSTAHFHTVLNVTRVFLTFVCGTAPIIGRIMLETTAYGFWWRRI